ncbi:hydantoinase/oxoprolinase N-terminal domain-containing protein [Nocardioides kongjuensis]|uniref:N-methylhydantoinase A/oxoprolinase/acetone carboxylase beta subunit n=1 Tax=Nocardioides kongjuensis TaxID=349522 RepID=A0A852RR58_9ACTN|nr:hydantoinase/oxoprolinase family protein [Nocardioides kongjuensis]NYD29102.1 N-methylhydantoinase A/oxoprolinase/acetone carboxylase beta subunit [Nocardioides kongjuensis]
MTSALRLGIDVGGTNTDAVLVDGRRVVAATKTSTTPDVTGGIVAAIADLGRVGDVDLSTVSAVMIGTTHFINALVEGTRLTPTAAIRFGLPATSALPPLADWPERLRSAIGGRGYLCHGGHEYDGSQVADFDERELRDVLDKALEAGARSFAVSSVFSPVNAEFELRAARIIAETAPGAPVSLSHDIGRMGLLGRENATVINAALRDLADRVTTGLSQSVSSAGITAPVFLSQNDGTLMDVDYARRYPVATFASGPTNSMRGAAFLSQQLDCAVVDVGGTTTDVGVLQSGFPREASADVAVAGVQTNFRMPDVLSLGIGGGSLVEGDPAAPRVGPHSVGHRLTEQAMVFGGDRLTATDLAVAAGLVDVGDRDRVAHLPPALVRAALDRIGERVGEVVDRMRISADPVPVVAVGGGSILVPDELVGASSVIRPENHAVANAIGAAIAEVGGEVDRVFSVSPGQRDTVLDEARQEAVDRATAAGARPGSVRVVDIEEVPLAYLPGNATRIRVKAVGELALTGPARAGHDHEHVPA